MDLTIKLNNFENMIKNPYNGYGHIIDGNRIIFFFFNFGWLQLEKSMLLGNLPPII